MLNTNSIYKFESLLQRVLLAAAHCPGPAALRQTNFAHLKFL